MELEQIKSLKEEVQFWHFWITTRPQLIFIPVAVAKLDWYALVPNMQLSSERDE